MSVYLDFEEPLKALEEQIEQTKEIGATTEVDMTDKINELEGKLSEKTKEIFSGLTPWQRVQLSRHQTVLTHSLTSTPSLTTHSRNFMATGV